MRLFIKIVREARADVGSGLTSQRFKAAGERGSGGNSLRQRLRSPSLLAPFLTPIRILGCGIPVIEEQRDTLAL